MRKGQGVFHIIGHPGTGKTTLVVDLIRELHRSGATVGTIKHSAHTHELDKPGKDSFLHREAGAAPVAMMNRHMTAVYLPWENGMTPDKMVNRFYTHLDVVLIEGWVSGPYYPKIEVWREIGKLRPPLFQTAANVKAVVVDGPLPPRLVGTDRKNGPTIFVRQNIEAIANFILSS